MGRGVPDEYQARHGEQLEGSGGTAWGVWQIPESELQVLGEVSGLDILELGCGAAQWSIALARRGARVTGLDNSERQLDHARKLMATAGVEFPLVHASAEATGIPAASFDVVFCDFGAMTFTDPGLSRAGGGAAAPAGRAVRVLRADADRGSRLALPGAEHPGEELTVDYWEEHQALRGTRRADRLPAALRRVDRAFQRAAACQIEDLIELRPPAGAEKELPLHRGSRMGAAVADGGQIWRARTARTQ